MKTLIDCYQSQSNNVLYAHKVVLLSDLTFIVLSNPILALHTGEFQDCDHTESKNVLYRLPTEGCCYLISSLLCGLIQYTQINFSIVISSESTTVCMRTQWVEE